ncbi:hemin transporter (plasmid) [Ralstonia solanacearum]|nr:hemin transporter [Ralstonia solanacearum]
MGMPRRPALRAPVTLLGGRATTAPTTGINVSLSTHSFFRTDGPIDLKGFFWMTDKSSRC